MWWIVSLALGAPPQPAPATVIEVVPSVLEGQFRLTCEGRDGDRVFVDGWEAGVLPLETALAEGEHEFRVDGAKGRLMVALYVKPLAGQTVAIDLAKPPESATAGTAAPGDPTFHHPAEIVTAPVPAPAPAPAPAAPVPAAPVPAPR